MIRAGSVIVTVLTLSGCSWLFGEDGLFPDNASRYQSASELPPIDVPPHLTTDAIQPDYPVPQVAASTQLATQFETPRPTPLTANNQSDSVRIQSLGGERWALSVANYAWAPVTVAACTACTAEKYLALSSCKCFSASALRAVAAALRARGGSWRPVGARRRHHG